MRKRVEPPLGEMLILDVAMTGRDASSSSAAIATKICATLAEFTAEKIAAHICGVTFKLSPTSAL